MRTIPANQHPLESEPETSPSRHVKPVPGPTIYIGLRAAAVKRGLQLALALAMAAGSVSAWEISSPVVAPAASGDLVKGFTPRELDIPAQAMPEVSARAALLASGDGAILWSRKADQKRAMASITKIMTAVVALEESDLDEKVEVPRSSSFVGESTAYLKPGDTLTMRDLLAALLVKSGNDAAIAVAEHVAGSEEAFVAKMNAKATELGLADTRFANAHGLDEAGHRTTASDLSVLARYAMANPEFRRIVGAKEVKIKVDGRTETLENTNLLIGNYRGVTGIKTGFTDDAGYCVIDSAERDGVALFAVVLGTKGELQRFRDARELLDWGFAHYRPQQLASKGTIIGESPVTDYLDLTVPAAVDEDARIPVLDVLGPITRTVTMTTVDAPVKKGERIGVATFTQRGEVIATVPLVATEDVAEPNPVQKVGIAIVRGWRRLTGAE